MFFGAHFQSISCYFHYFLEKYSRKVFVIQKKAVPLHPLSKGKRIKEAFFERIYIKQTSSTRAISNDLEMW